jgi:hypothetical protein
MMPKSQPISKALLDAIRWVRKTNKALSNVDDLCEAQLVTLVYTPSEEGDEFSLKFLNEIIYDSVDFDDKFDPKDVDEDLRDVLDRRTDDLTLQRGLLFEVEIDEIEEI